MNANERRLQFDRITNKIIGCVYRVSNRLGCGFLEKVYENALAIEVRRAGLQCHQHRPIQVFYDGLLVGEYVADLMVEGQVIVELKAARAFDDVHLAQCINYLRASHLNVCLLINFGTPRVQIRRVVSNY